MVFTSAIDEQLRADLDPSRVMKREGSYKKMLSYLSGEDVARTANRIFGIGGWSTQVTQFPTLITNGMYQATVRVTAHDAEGGSVSYEDTGIGTHVGDTSQEIEKAVKESVTDAMKRAFVSLGDQFGLCLYDKAHPVHKLASGGTADPVEGFNSSPAKPLTKKATPAELPPPNDGEGFKCDECGKPIKASASRSAAENAAFGYKESGKIRCFSCRQIKAKP